VIAILGQIGGGCVVTLTGSIDACSPFHATLSGTFGNDGSGCLYLGDSITIVFTP